MASVDDNSEDARAGMTTATSPLLPSNSFGGGSSSDGGSARVNHAAHATVAPMSRDVAEDNDCLDRTATTTTKATIAASTRPLILITDSNEPNENDDDDERSANHRGDVASLNHNITTPQGVDHKQPSQKQQEEEEQFEEIDGIKYRIVAAVTRPRALRQPCAAMDSLDGTSHDARNEDKSQDNSQNKNSSRFSNMRRKSSAFVANLLSSAQQQQSDKRPRRLSIYEMTKSPPPETSLEIYLSERRRSSTVSARHVQQQIEEQQSTFETNYCQRQQYFRDLNAKFINKDKKLLNVVANRGQIHRHSVDIAQLPLELAAKLKARAANSNLLEPSFEGTDDEHSDELKDKLASSGELEKSNAGDEFNGESSNGLATRLTNDASAAGKQHSARLAPIVEHTGELRLCFVLSALSHVDNLLQCARICACLLFCVLAKN